MPKSNPSGASTIPECYRAYPKTLLDLMDCIRRQLESLGFPADLCIGMAGGIMEAIRLEFRGSLIYIPTIATLKRQQRNAAICREFNNQNHRQLAQRYGLSIHTIYDILAKHREHKADSTIKDYNGRPKAITDGKDDNK